MKSLALRASMFWTLLLSATCVLHAAPSHEEEAGRVVATIGSKSVSLPMLKSDYDVAIDGTVATVTLKQTFLNTQAQAVNATYLFPLNQKAAVYSMTMEVGEETIQAVIQRKEDARKTFEAAKSQGKAASLLVQHRPNMFTQNIANLMPSMPVTVTLKYVQHVPKVEEAYELVIPLVVGPRYEGAVPAAVARKIGQAFVQDAVGRPYEHEETPDTESVSGWTVGKLPVYPPVFGQDAPGEIDRKRVGFDLELKSPVPISSVHSSTHSLAFERKEQMVRAKFAGGRVIGNKDLVLRYELGEDRTVTAGALSHFDQRGGFVSLQIEPPKMPVEDMVTPRELVFVLDTSGSMHGHPIRASKDFMRAALKGMRPDDHFRILRFSNNTSQFSQNAVRATPANVQAGLQFVDGLSAGGGTEINRAINAAFDFAPVENTMRIVVFLSDGYIGADRQVIQTVSRRIGSARIYAFGVGRGVNRYLLEGMAKEGRGRVRYIEAGEIASEVAETFARELDAPLLTDIEVDWDGLAVRGQSPERIPDLFAGGAVNVLARYKQGGEHRIIVKGLVNGRKAAMPLSVRLADSQQEEGVARDSALPVIWAREKVFDLERAYTISGGTNKRIKEKTTKLGLDFALQTAFTSFVAVSQEVYNQTPALNSDTNVAVPQVSGVGKGAYPSLHTQTPGQQAVRSVPLPKVATARRTTYPGPSFSGYSSLNLSGSSTPEPEQVLGLMGVFMLLLLRFRQVVSRTLKLLAHRWEVLKNRVRKQHNKGLPSRLVSAG